jgi:hypothetical protein
MRTLKQRLVKRYLRKYTLQRLPLAAGKLLPAGLGAIIGGVGNRTLGKIIVNNSRKVFGPAPRDWPSNRPHIIAPYDEPSSS